MRSRFEFWALHASHYRKLPLQGFLWRPGGLANHARGFSDKRATPDISDSRIAGERAGPSALRTDGRRLLDFDLLTFLSFSIPRSRL